jgi:uncharacterized protein (DUF305 family)
MNHMTHFRAVAAGAAVALMAIAPLHAQAVLATSTAPSSPASIAKARADSARYPYTSADIEFMDGMIHHHSQAIVMARMAPTHGAGPAVRTLCQRIINAQGDEIRLMQQWLRDRQLPVTEATAGPMKMKMDGMEMDMLMPGMLSEQQMKDLDAARGLEFDRLFLTFMIQHHTGAVGMVSDLFKSAGGGQDEAIFKFANDVNVDQTTEIDRMQKMLTVVVFEGRTP